MDARDERHAEPPHDAAELQRLLGDLDAEQRRAVTEPGNPLRILAGAGSGKTRVLTRRIAYRVATGDADPRKVMALTFTRKAAGELASRLARLGLRDLPTAGTFHALAYAQLRQRWAGADRRPPALLDRKGRLLSRLLVRGGRLGVGELSAEIEWAKARQITPDRYAAEAERADRRPPASVDRIARLFADYEAEKRHRHLVDFDDLLARCRDALAEDREFARVQRWRFRHLFVDEFQDVNPLQFSLLRAWLGPSDDLCVVGDPNQAIYRWNGADAGYLIDFAEHLPGAHTVALATNYRSTHAIVTAASAVLAASPDRTTAAAGPTPRAVRGAGPSPSVREEPTAELEAVTIARAVRDRRGPRSPWRSQAVLVRTNAQAAQLDAALRRAGIPTRLRGAAALLQQPAVRDALRSAGSSPQPLVAWVTDLEETLRDLDSVDERSTALNDLARLGRELLTLEPTARAGDFGGWLAANLRHEAGDDRRDAVDVVTFHASKGLEWPVVHLAGLEDGYVPISWARTAEARAEERRLLYVAMTRARDELVMSWARQRAFGDRLLDRAPSPWLARLHQGPAAAPEGAAALREHLGRSRAALDGGTDPRPTEQPAAAELADRALQTWRRRIARGAGVPPRVVLADRALKTLATRRPRDLDQLTALGVLGPIPIARYGTELLAVLAAASQPPASPASAHR